MNKLIAVMSISLGVLAGCAQPGHGRMDGDNMKKHDMMMEDCKMQQDEMMRKDCMMKNDEMMKKPGY